MRDTTIQIRHSMSCFSGGMKGSKKQQLVTCSIELLDDTIHTVKVKVSKYDYVCTLHIMKTVRGEPRLPDSKAQRFEHVKRSGQSR